MIRLDALQAAVSEAATQARPRDVLTQAGPDPGAVIYNGFGSPLDASSAEAAGVLSPFAFAHSKPGTILRWDARVVFRGHRLTLGTYESHAEAQAALDAGLEFLRAFGNGADSWLAPPPPQSPSSRRRRRRGCPCVTRLRASWRCTDWRAP